MDGKTSYISLGLLVDLLLLPYQDQIAIGSGGGGSSNDRDWRDREDERKPFRFHFKPMKPNVKPSRGRKH